MALDLYTIIIYPIIYIFPAYLANALPVIFGKGASPIDRGKKWNGKRILGENKTVRGTLSGIIGGIAIGYIESLVFGLSYLFAISIALSIGAMIGDIIGSFIKRRLSLNSGQGVPILDQYGFFIVAMLLAFPLGNLPNLYGIIFLIILTGIMHPLTNAMAYVLRIKKVPW